MKIILDLDETTLKNLGTQAETFKRSRKRHMEAILEEAAGASVDIPEIKKDDLRPMLRNDHFVAGIDPAHKDENKAWVSVFKKRGEQVEPVATYLHTTPEGITIHSPATLIKGDVGASASDFEDKVKEWVAEVEKLKARIGDYPKSYAPRLKTLHDNELRFKIEELENKIKNHV